MPLHLVGGSPRFNEVNLDVLNSHLAVPEVELITPALRFVIGAVLHSSKVRDVALLSGRMSFEATYSSPTSKTEASVRLQINDKNTKHPYDSRLAAQRPHIDHWLGGLLGISIDELLDNPTGQFDRLAHAPRQLSYANERYRLTMAHEKNVGHGRHLVQRREYEETLKGTTRDHEYTCSFHRRIDYPEQHKTIAYSQYVDLNVKQGKIFGSRNQETDPKFVDIENLEALLRQPCSDGHENQLIGGLRGADINTLFSGAIDFDDLQLRIDADPFADPVARNRPDLRVLRPDDVR